MGESKRRATMTIALHGDFRRGRPIVDGEETIVKVQRPLFSSDPAIKTQTVAIYAQGRYRWREQEGNDELFKAMESEPKSTHGLKAFFKAKYNKRTQAWEITDLTPAPWQDW